MNLDELYCLLKLKLKEMYESGSENVKLTQAEFFMLYQAICYLKQIKRITDDM